MEYSKVLHNRQTYTSDTIDIKCDVKNLIELIFGMDALVATTAPTLANLLDHTKEITVTVGGEVVTLVKMVDLFALNHFLLRHRPFYLIGSSDNDVITLENVKLPIHLTTDKPANVKLSYTGHANIDTEKLTVTARYRDGPFSNKPYSIKYISNSIAVTEKEFDFQEAGKKLEALLLYMTTIPNGATLDYTVGTLKILINRAEKYHRHMNSIRGRAWQPEDTTIGGILDNYAFLRFPEPFPADALKLEMKSLASATDAFRAIGVYK